MNTKVQLQRQQKRLMAAKRTIDAAAKTAIQSQLRAARELESARRELGRALAAEALGEGPATSVDELRAQCALHQRTQEESALMLTELERRTESLTMELQSVADELLSQDVVAQKAKEIEIINAISHVTPVWTPVRMRQEFESVAKRFGVTWMRVDTLWRRNRGNANAAA